MYQSSKNKLIYVYFLMAILIGAAIFSKYNDKILIKMKITKNSQKMSELDYQAASCVYKVHHKNVSVAWMYHTVTIKWEPSENCSKAIQDLIRIRNGSILRVQAYSNNEMVTANAVYSENDTYTANLLLTIPGRFIVIVLLTYINGDDLEPKHHVKPILKQIQGSPYEVTLLPSKVPNGVTRYCTRLESGQARGRWVKCGNLLGDLYPPLERCGPWQSDPNFDFDHIHGFRWLPYGCQLHHYTNGELKRCLAKNRWRSLVFAGDSHMRYRVYHWVTRLYGACHSCAKTHIKMVFNKIPRIEWIFDARGTRLPLTFKNISLPFEKYIHPKVRRSKFSAPFPEDAMASDLFVMNFGHWALRESTDFEFMESKLAAYAESIGYLRQSGKRVVWVNTVSLPWRSDQAVIDWKENTSPSRVRQFNRLADQYMKAYDIPIVDAFQISDGRIAATHDQTHYAKRLPGNDFGGVVENAISNSIINSLCNSEK